MTIQALGNRDKMKDDAIAQLLSDQLMALIARMHEIERRQQPYGFTMVTTLISSNIMTRGFIAYAYSFTRDNYPWPLSLLLYIVLMNRLSAHIIMLFTPMFYKFFLYLF